MAPEAPSPVEKETAPSAPVFVGLSDRTMDKQARVQLPPEWLSSGRKEFVAAIGEPHSSAVAVFLPESIHSMIPPLKEGDYERKPLREMAKKARDFRHVTVDSSGRLPLTDPELKQALVFNGEPMPVKLSGALRYFFICRSDRWPEIDRDLNKA